MIFYKEKAIGVIVAHIAKVAEKAVKKLISRTWVYFKVFYIINYS